jgi:ABC-type bacteriocin/lantibiotic exporter with double-glycine peptidase domain
MVCMVGYSATEGVMPFLVQWMIDDVFVKKDVAMLHCVPAAVISVFPVRGLTLQSLRSLIGVVTRHTFLFNMQLLEDEEAREQETMH